MAAWLKDKRTSVTTGRYQSVFRIRIHFLRIRIRIQRIRMEANTDPDTDPLRIQGFNGQKLKKNNSWKKNYIFFGSKTAIYLSLGLHKVCPGYRRSLQLTKEAIQHFKTWIFSTFVGHFALLDPDPDSEYGSGFGSTGPIENGSNPDPDPKLCVVICNLPLLQDGSMD